MKYKFVFAFSFSILLLVFVSCQKDWLDKKPDVKLVVPTAIDDFQALLDNIQNVNQCPGLGEVGSDNYYIAPTTIISQDALTINTYIWAANGFQGNTSIADWTFLYQTVYICNKSLEGLSYISTNSSNKASYNNVYGSALFFRAYSFFNLAQTFAKGYNATTANSDLGVPLRLESDITTKVGRGTLQGTYDQVISDFNQALNYLPNTQAYTTRPTKGAIYGMLSRVYIAMQDYDKAYKYSDSCLQLYNSLLDYNTLNNSGSSSFPQFNNNPEIVFMSYLLYYSNFGQSRSTIDSNLYASYASNDLRKQCFFRTSSGRIVWAGDYSGSTNTPVNALCVDELYLTRAECNARKGDFNAAMNDLNTVLQKRWKAGTFVPVTASSADDALTKVLNERRKELCFRGLRWTDLRRLNLDSRFAITLSRIYNGQTYTLTPNDNKYVWPIPDNEILYSNIQQNPR